MMQENEIWRPIRGYEGLYQVSALGRVRSLDREAGVKCGSGRKPRFAKGRVLCGGKNGRGYIFVYLCKDGTASRFYVHRLVASAFVENPYGYQIVNHKDQNPSNNRADNLEWCSQSYNVHYGDAIEKIRAFNLSDKNPNRGKHRPESFKEKVRKPILQIDKNGKIIREWDSARTAGDTLGIFPQSITAVCRSRYKSYKNYVWRYKNDCPDTAATERDA